MSEFSAAFLARAREALSGAESEFVNKRYNNVANRAYYACFQAAIAALDRAQIRPSRGTIDWSHEFVQGQFVGVLIGRRKAYSSAYVDSLGHTRSLRTQADYKEAPVSQTQAYRALRRSRSFVAAIEAGGDTDHEHR